MQINAWLDGPFRMASTWARSAILRTSEGDVHGGSGLSITVVDCASARAPEDWA